MRERIQEPPLAFAEWPRLLPAKAAHGPELQLSAASATNTQDRLLYFFAEGYQSIGSIV